MPCAADEPAQEDLRHPPTTSGASANWFRRPPPARRSATHEQDLRRPPTNEQDRRHLGHRSPPLILSRIAPAKARFDRQLLLTSSTKKKGNHLLLVVGDASSGGGRRRRLPIHELCCCLQLPSHACATAAAGGFDKLEHLPDARACLLGGGVLEWTEELVPLAVWSPRADGGARPLGRVES